MAASDAAGDDTPVENHPAYRAAYLLARWGPILVRISFAIDAATLVVAYLAESTILMIVAVVFLFGDITANLYFRKQRKATRRDRT